MSVLTLSFAAQAMNAKWTGKAVTLTGVSTDTRSVSPGDLFVALPGSRVDGHDYIREAEAKGAVGVVVSRPVETLLPILLVPNTLKALGELAQAYRQQFKLPMVAITGSCGKTTVKEMLNSILSLQGPILSTQGNLNTEVGVPLTLLRLQPEHRLAIVEMGARHKGDIAYLMSLASPTVSLITNAGAAHLEIFGTEKGIAEAKGEIFECLLPTGTAVINQDDIHADYWKTLIKSGQSVITFGLQHTADIMAKNIILEALSSQFDLVTDRGTISIKLSIPGKHAIQNGLAAAATARTLGISLEDIKTGLERFVSVSGRLQFKKGFQGVTIIDDTYNANPISMRAALSVLAKHAGSKIFVMGDMFELGKEERLLHQKIGEEAKQLGIDKLFGVGNLTVAAVEGFGEGALHYTDKMALVNALRQDLNKNTMVLVKGSRGMRMEEVVLKLTTDCQEKNIC